MVDNSEPAIIYPNFKRSNLVEKVFDTLRENILSGVFNDGDLLPTQELLARQFGVSRTVLREALNKLSSLGLVKSHQGRGTYVHTPNMQTVFGPMLSSLQLTEEATQELIEARYYLESTIVQLAAKRAQREQVLALKRSIAQMEQGMADSNIKIFSSADLSFHLQLAEMSQNRVLLRIIEVIREMLVKFLEDFNQVPGTQQRAIAYHKKIYTAIKANDPIGAEIQMRKHLEDVLCTFQKEHKKSKKV